METVKGSGIQWCIIKTPRPKSALQACRFTFWIFKVIQIPFRPEL